MSETPIEQFIKTLNDMRSDLEKALDKQIDIDKFISVLVFYIKKNIGLLEKDRQSLVNSIRDAATDGLLIDGREGYISPYKGVLKFGAMTAGIVKKLALAGVSVNPQVVRQNDKFEYWTDELGQHIKHAPDPFDSIEKRGLLVGAYSIAKTSDGFIHIEIMSKEDVMKVKSKSNNQTGLMWTEFEEEGYKKSVIRRGYKWLPKNPKLDDFFKREDEQEYDFTETQEIKPARITSRVEEIINKSEKENPIATDKEIIETMEKSDKEPEIKKVEGLIVKIGILGEKNKRYCCKIGEATYGTDSESMYVDAIEPLFKSQTAIILEFIEGENSSGTFRDIRKIDYLVPPERPFKKELPL